MSQTQLYDLTAGAGDGANLGLIANVLGNKGGEGRWESMRLLSAGVFGLENTALSPQRERLVPSSPCPLPPSGQSPPSLASEGQGGRGSGDPCPWGHAVGSESQGSAQNWGTSPGAERGQWRGCVGGWGALGALCPRSRIGTTGNVITWGGVGWCLGEVSFSAGEAQSHGST